MITRRDFLKLGAVSTAVLFLPIRHLIQVAVAEQEYKGRIYRGTTDGEIYVSDDQRGTWTRHINLGEQCRISRIFSNTNDDLHARVDFQGYDFDLVLSPNGKDWLVM